MNKKILLLIFSQILKVFSMKFVWIFIYFIWYKNFQCTCRIGNEVSKTYSRRFYIRHDDKEDCRTDAGWLLVGDDKGNCQYEKDIKEKPFILFSNKSTSSKGYII